MVHHRIARPDASLDRGTDVTEIIAFDEFGAMVDVAGSHGDPFAIDYEVLSAPELDDLNDVADESPRLLLLPKGESNAATPAVPIPIDGASAREGQRLSGRAALKGVSVRSSRGAHRRTSEATGAAHSRLVITAVAAGAVAAAANTAVNAAETQQPVLVADTAEARLSLRSGRSGRRDFCAHSSLFPPKAC